MKTKTLLEIALETPYTPQSAAPAGDREELLDLALAYANREITSSQALAAYRIFLGPKRKISGGNHISRFGSVIVGAIRKGILKVERIK